MSDTPLTDAVEAKLHDPLYPTTAPNNLHTMANHARTLERRNAELVEALGRVANSSTIIDEFDVEWAAATDTVDVANATLDRNGGGK